MSFEKPTNPLSTSESRSTIRKTVSSFLYQLTRLCQFALNPRSHLATLTLFAILQKAPALVRLLNSSRHSIEPATKIFQRIALTATSLGAAHAVSGATFNETYLVGTESPDENLFEGDETISLEIRPGQYLNLYFAIDLPGSYNAASWRIVGTPPPELEFTGRLGESINESGYINSTFGFADGTLSTIGTYQFTLQPFEEPDGGGDTAEALIVRIEVKNRPISAPGDTTPLILVTRTGNSLIASWENDETRTYQLQTSTTGSNWSVENATPTTNGTTRSVAIDLDNSPLPYMLRLMANDG